MKVFLSYSSKDEKYTSNLDSELLKFGVNIIRDIRELKPLQNITKFMADIAYMDYSIMLISENYLKSKPCIFEFTEYLKKENAPLSMIPIIIGDFTFTNIIRNNVLSHIQQQTSKEVKKIPWFMKIISVFRSKPDNENDWIERFNKAWDFLTSTKLFNYKASEEINFSDILTFLNVYDEEIIASLGVIDAITDLEEQDIEYDKLLKQHPGSYWIIRYRATLCSKKKQYKKSIFYHEEFMMKFSNPIDKVPSYYDIGVCYYKLNEYDKAIIAHNEAIKIMPWAYLSFRGLGDVYMKQKNFDKAFECYEFSNRFQKNYLVLNNMGSIQSERGNSREAIRLFHEAIELNKDELIAYQNLAITYKKINDLKSYGDILESTLQIFPDNYELLTNFAMYNIVHQQGDPLTLINMLKKSYRLNPKYINTRMYLGYLLMLYYAEDKENKEIEFAKKILLETLKMKISTLEQDFTVGNLKLLCIVVQDYTLLNKLKQKYPE